MGATGIGRRDIIGTFFAKVEEYSTTGWGDLVARTFNSDQASEIYKWLGMPPAMREWRGGRQAKGIREDGVTIVNKTWEATLGLPVDWIRRDKTGQINIRISELAQQAVNFKAELLSLFIDNGGGSTYGLCYDGQYFFDTDHSTGNSGTQTNHLVASDAASLNVGTATAPTTAELNAAIGSVIQHMFGFKDDNGKPMNANAKSFLVMLPTNMLNAGVNAVASPIVYSSSGSYPNALTVAETAIGFNVRAVVNPLLTDTDAFVVFRTDAPASALIFQEEEGITISAIAEGSEHEFKNNEHLYGAKRICNAGYGYWQYACKATLS
ncbi:MAG TPA: Mu-like prophage major head subunit gpT family protein [Syntrophales bacterium]|nr:Mu-like prophage major head subunit gpT family protein [Syntrophales bacterium]